MKKNSTPSHKGLKRINDYSKILIILIFYLFSINFAKANSEIQTCKIFLYSMEDRYGYILYDKHIELASTNIVFKNNKISRMKDIKFSVSSLDSLLQGQATDVEATIRLLNRKKTKDHEKRQLRIVRELVYYSSEDKNFRFNILKLSDESFHELLLSLPDDKKEEIINSTKKAAKLELEQARVMEDQFKAASKLGLLLVPDNNWLITEINDQIQKNDKKNIIIFTASNGAWVKINMLNDVVFKDRMFNAMEIFYSTSQGTIGVKFICNIIDNFDKEEAKTSLILKDPDHLDFKYYILEQFKNYIPKLEYNLRKNEIEAGNYNKTKKLDRIRIEWVKKIIDSETLRKESMKILNISNKKNYNTKYAAPIFNGFFLE